MKHVVFMHKLNQYMSKEPICSTIYVYGLPYDYSRFSLRFRDMSNLNNLDFTALEVSGRNYLKWVQDVKLHLTAKCIRAAIETHIADKPVDEAQKATAMIFIRRHIHDALQTEYLAEEDPRTLWLALADRFDQKKDIYLPEARHDWQHLRFQDFKSVNEYIYEVCRIRSLLKFCKVELTKSDLLEKTYLTFNATNIVL